MSDEKLFEMRRLEALSNTVFGVAMTLLAYDLPEAASLPALPSFVDLYKIYAPHLAALTLSFAIAGLFWLSHHRRLAHAPMATQRVVMLNVAFLATIVLLPAMNGLYASHLQSAVIATLYAGHLTLISAINAVLWLLALRPDESRLKLAPALVPMAVFTIAAAVASVRPTAAPWVFMSAFATPLVSWLITRRAS